MKNDKSKIKRGDVVRLTKTRRSLGRCRPVGKVLNVSSDAQDNPIASVHWADNDRVEVLSLAWLEIFEPVGAWEISDTGITNA